MNALMSPEELSPAELSALLTSFMPDIPGYRVMRRIGQGGMSHVYLGLQESLDRQVAIKVMQPEALADEKSKQRFEQEARTIAKLEHPFIVGIHEVGRTPQGLFYYVLPYLPKGHLGQRDFSNNEARIAEVLRALLSALEYAHARGIVHRDVKAENVLFDNTDGPQLADFGIAFSKRDHSRITSAGLALGSGGYMAPEQARGEAVDGRADLYSVGVLAFELLSGHLPYISSDPLALALLHAQEPIPRLPPARQHWQAFIDQAMAKAPENRFRNAQHMMSALDQVAQERQPLVAVIDADSLPTPGTKLIAESDFARTPSRLKPAWLGLAAVGVLLLVAIFTLRTKTPVTTSASTKQPDFFTAHDLDTSKPPAPTAAVKPTPGTVTSPIAAPVAAAAIAQPVTMAYGNVQSAVTVTPLDYDPGVPGEYELSAARRRIAQNRLSTPPGDNAMEFLLAARMLAPASVELHKLSDQVIAGMASNINDAIKRRRDELAKTIYRRTQKFAKDSQRLDGDAWKSLRNGLPALLIARLEQSVRNHDPSANSQTKSLSTALAVNTKLLEPAWSLAVTAAKPAVPTKEYGPPTVLVTAKLAFMREEVNRSDYARFATATHRGTARCRNRTAPISLKKRSWVDPGFAQSGNHPVVCVSYDDARAYALWLSERTGQIYRLPTAAEWKLIADYRGSGDACRDGHIDCGSTGTGAANEGPSSPMGVLGVHGNAREWLSDCAGNCSRREVAGLGWRDPANRAEPLRQSGFAANTGLDDVGFRLVHEFRDSR